jgi:6-pyruvoyltetrahydropterin/6-carboxytetrahydropterin synthase
MDLMQIEKKYHFYAAHRNKGAGEKCGRIHGHTYHVKIWLLLKEKDSSGVTILFSSIDELIEPIIKEYDHYLILNDKDSLCDVLSLANEPYKTLPFETSLENLSIWFFTRIKNETKLPITKIEIAETLTSKVIYEGK